MKTAASVVVRHGGPVARNYSRTPLIVYCEMTHEESRELLRQIASFGEPLPHLILTGGDPLQRPDLYDMIDEAQSLGLQVSITPSATEALTPAVIARLKAHGIQSL